MTRQDTETNSPSHEHLPVHIYSAGKRFSIGQTFAAIYKEFPVAHSLGFRFAERNIKARYRHSVFGILWALLPPAATAAIWIILNHNHIIQMDHTGTSYPLFVITGTMLWSVFSTAVMMPIQTMQANTSILVKINFPREALMINAFYEILFNTGITLLIIAAEILIFRVPLTAQSLLFFPALFILIIFGMALGLLLLPVSFLFRDIQHALPIFLQFAMYLTPVVYAKPMYGGLSKLLNLNPVSPILTNARSWLLGIETTTPFWQIGLIGLASLLLLVLGIILQRITMEILIERMGS